MARAAVLVALLIGLTPWPAWAQPASLTLAEAITRARAEAPIGAAARARLEASRLAVDEAGRPLNPVFEFRTENLWSGAPSGALPHDTFAEVTQTLELGGKRGARRGIAQAGAGAAEAAATLVSYQIARDVSRAFMHAVRLRDRQRALAAQTADLAEIVRVLGRRVAEGTTAEADLLKLRVEHARAETNATLSGIAAARALTDIAALADVGAISLDALASPNAPPLPAAVTDSAIARRPDVIVAQRGVESARQALALESARGVPDLAVNAGYKRTLGYNSGLLTFSMAIPLFERNRVGSILAEGQVAAATRELAATERRARAEAAAARLAAEALTVKAQVARRQLVEPALGARDAARSAFALGALDVLRLVDAERVYTEAALVAIDVEAEAVLAAIEARLAAGEEPLP
jgi:cobalt-zinc-cadmium efflux system outer membrane protein